ncbi:MAG: histidine--tRNA ligase [Bacillota bacterium]
MAITSLTGMKDVLPVDQESWLFIDNWQRLEELMRWQGRLFGFREMRTPLLEMTELFARGVGDTTDVVTKEMYSFTDRGDRPITVRPELTAGLVRAFIEHKLYALPQPTKVFGIGPAFRYERPQAGRLRQHHQWSVEVFGSQDPATDAEVIQIGIDLASRLGLEGLTVHLNSIGCPVCRPGYREKLKDYFRPHLPELCPDCNERFEKNPLRILDCKVDRDKPFMAGAPKSIDHLCEECAGHFEGVQKHLQALEIPFEIDTGIVRGLDYYTKTVFEVIYPPLGAQSTVWGGGRYDGLVETLGGPPTPGIGFGMGLERVLLTLEEMGLTLPPQPPLDAFVATIGDAARNAALPLAARLRRAGLSAELDVLGRSLKAQMKYADRLGARYVVILGDDELAQGEAQVKDMAGSEQHQVPLEDLAFWIEERKAAAGGGRPTDGPPAGHSQNPQTQPENGGTHRG